MARVKLLSAMAYDAATFDESGVADPVIRVLGELPANSRPFRVNRVYKGPQGTYEETMLLVDPENVVIWESDSTFVELRGMMFEDLFRDRIDRDIEIAVAEEHTLVFLLDGGEAGRIPVFVDAPESLRASGVFGEAAQQALKKSAVLWLEIPQPDGTIAQRPAWYVQDGAKLFVLTGPGEQNLPYLADSGVVDVTVKSKDVKASIGAVTADVRVVENDSEEFERIATLGMGNRLNLPDGEGALDRWKSTCTLVELSPRY